MLGMLYLFRSYSLVWLLCLVYGACVYKGVPDEIQDPNALFASCKSWGVKHPTLQWLRVVG